MNGFVNGFVNGLSIAAGSIALTACTVMRIDDGTPFATRPIAVKASAVAVYERPEDTRGPYTEVDSVFVKDDGDTLPRELEKRLRVMAGARGANAIVLAKTNRKLNDFRTYVGIALDNPLDYYSATAVWIGAGPPPVKVLKQ